MTIAHSFDSIIGSLATSEKGSEAGFWVGKVKETEDSEPEGAVAIRVKDVDGEVVSQFAMSLDTFGALMDAMYTTFERMQLE